ncbi:MAG: prolipoprotein diacylglyceryl transferase [Cyclobacteriaceae bacterium]
MLERLQQRWGLKSIGQVVIVLLVFAATGTTIMLLRDPIVGLFSENGERSVLFTILYYLLILPVYNVILLAYGFLFGQFDFFWQFEKKMWARMTGQKIKNPDERGFE